MAAWISGTILGMTYLKVSISKKYTHAQLIPLPSTVRSLVEALLRQDPAQRATVERALQHHWIASELEDLVQVYTQRILH